MTRPRPWPPSADAARMDSIASARAINNQVMEMQQLLAQGKPISMQELAIRLIRINNETNRIVQRLLVTGPLKFKKEI